MNITLKGNQKTIAVVQNDSLLITDLQSALDLAMTISYETGSHKLILPKECVAENFFILSTRLAGEILQKYVNYGINLAIVGDFSNYTSEPLRDFIYESNHGRNFYFVSTQEEAIERLEGGTGKSNTPPQATGQQT
nr:DUF4180 domain-containing protein [uncultured Eisenbergiella sp.]